MTTSTKTVGISERALLARIRRKLLNEGSHGEMLRWDRGGQLGWHIVDIRGNYLVAQGCDLLDLAKELDCIRPWERLEDSK